jgi:N-acetylglucosamine malate deacetylase 1
MNQYISDILVIAAHPDDAELGAGGTIAKLTNSGKSVSIVDLTRGESGTRGTPEIRIAESISAAKILNIKHRMNLEMPDGKLSVDDDSIMKVMTMIRLFRPKAVLINPPFDRHPDHETAHKIVRKAMFKSGLRKFETKYEGQVQQVHRIRKMFAFMQSYQLPQKHRFYVDVSDTFETKMDSIKAYASQVFIEGKSNTNEPATRLSRPEFLEELQARAIYFGTLVGARYAEPFYSVEPLIVNTISDLF